MDPSGSSGTRTRDLLLAEELRYQLRHAPIGRILVSRTREPVAVTADTSDDAVCMTSVSSHTHCRRSCSQP